MVCFINLKNLINSFEPIYNNGDDEKDRLISALIDCESIQELQKKYPNEYNFYIDNYSESFDEESDYDDILINVIFFE